METTFGMTSLPSLPRLAVVSDVTVERTAGGMLLLYRLLRNYPPGQLLILSSGALSSGKQDDRLPAVMYEPAGVYPPRIIRGRLNPVWPFVDAAIARRQAAAVIDRLREFAPDAILTTTTMLLWLVAAAAARRLAVPLHLILHDDWPTWHVGERPRWSRPAGRWACRRVMAPVYRAALSRLCISPGMEEHYRRLFGAPGRVLYPCRGEDSPACTVRVRPEPGGPPVIAYCGWVHLADGPGTRLDILRKSAAVVAARGGHLDLYTQTPRHLLEARGLRPPVVRFCGFFSPDNLADRLGRTAHLLIANASFDRAERDEVATLFPSKMADYTAVGLPILVWGPKYSAAARWAAENPEATVLVTTPDPEPVVKEVDRLVDDPAHAARLAAAAITAGNRYFTLDVARTTLYNCLAAPAQTVA